MSRQEDCTTATTRGRLQKAEQTLLAAETIAEVREQRLGVCSKGQDHDAATGLLARVDRKASQQLNVLLNMKHKAGYSARPVSGTVHIALVDNVGAKPPSGSGRKTSYLQARRYRAAAYSVGLDCQIRSS